VAAPPDRPDRQAGARGTRRSLAVVGGLLVVAAAAAAALLMLRRDDDATPAAATTAARSHVVAHVRAAPIRVAATPAGRLAAPLQDAAGVVVGRTVLLVGGLDAADVSTADVRVLADRRARRVGRVGHAFHDAAAASIGGDGYVFGGGDGVRQLDAIVRVDPASGATAPVGRLPTPSSDHAAAVVGGTAYVVGGYTGSAWLDTIVAWRPRTRARVVGHLPAPVRYAAVAAAAGRVVVAGGSLTDGSASRAVYVFDPATRRVRRIGSLPAPTTHATAAAFRGHVLVIGGRRAQPGTASSAIVAVDPLSRRIRRAGQLPRPLSDAAAVGLRNSVLVAGGRGAATVSGVERVRAAPPHLLGKAQRVVANVYAHDGPNALSRVVRRAPPRVYVPNSASNTVDVVDQRTFKIVAHYAVGRLPQHVTPSFDLKTLWVDNDEGDSLTPVSAVTGKPKGRPVRVDDPYNLYFTPSGRYAIVVAEGLHRLDFRFAHSMKLHHSLHVPCSGVDHMDFTADGRFLLASCEFSAEMVKVDVRRERLVKVIRLRAGAMPQDVKLSPDGRVFYVADMAANGVWEIDSRTWRVQTFLRTGAGAHGLYPSRDAKRLFIPNRGEGTISVLDFAKRRLVAKWDVGGSPDMGGVSADGKVLWLSGRYDAQLYAISTRDGHVLARIRVGYEPHGVCVWPQPGRYSLGHTGILR
jgi:DNA-binding beta-propeller fold protein YncE